MKPRRKPQFVGILVPQANRAGGDGEDIRYRFEGGPKQVIKAIKAR